MKHVVSFSGGVASAMEAHLVARAYGKQNTLLLFADTLIEDEDLHRFSSEIVAYVGAEFIRIAEGRTPWQVFRAERFIGNSRVDPCSKILKRKLLDKWIKENAPDSVVYVGMYWDEWERVDRFKARMHPQPAESLTCAQGVSQQMAFDWLNSIGIKRPRLYDLGFAHNNCGGFCPKAGQAQFKLLLEKFPERFAEHERQEEELRKELGDYSVLRDRRGGTSKTLTLRQFRERFQCTGQYDMLDEAAGCGCAVDEEGGAK